MVNAYQQFMKDNIHSCEGANMREKFKHCVAKWRQYKLDSGAVASVAKKEKKRGRKPRGCECPVSGGELAYAPVGGNFFKTVLKKAKDSGLLDQALNKGLDVVAKKYLGGSNFKKFQQEKSKYEKHSGRGFYDELMAGALTSYTA
jgi:tRNA U38,U39,U40 pseudouridine synthase TruA